MPRALRRGRTVHQNIGGGAPPGQIGGGGTGTAAMPNRGRTMPRRAVGNGSTTSGGLGKNYLATPKQNVAISDGPITAVDLTNFVNQLCETEAAQPGYIAQHPSWAFNLGVRMFGGTL